MSKDVEGELSVNICRGNYDGYVKHKRNDPMYDPWDSQGNEKCSFYFYYFCSRNRNCNFLIPLGIPTIAHWIISFMLHISVITSLQTDTYIDELVEIFLKLSVKTVQVHLIICTTLGLIPEQSCMKVT